MKEITKRTLTEHSEALLKKEYSSCELVGAYLSEIDRTDKEIGAFLHVDAENALKNAKKADQRRAAGAALGALDGIPIALKDNICTSDMPTTCASRMLEGYTPPYDAFVAEKLKSSGLIIIGKNNMDEFAMGSTGEFSAFKTVRNPKNTKHSAGGSSGGSAAAVSAHQIPASLGSDTGGSVRLPASFCGAVALKPTYGRVSRYGLVAFASSLDQIGPITATVRDNASLFDIIQGKDPKDLTSFDCKSTEEGSAFSVKGARIALPRELFGASIADEVKAAVMSAAKHLEGMGAELVEISLPSLKHALPAYYIISCAEASSNLSRFDSVRYGKRAENASTREEMYKLSRSEYLGDEVKRRILLGSYLLSEGYRDKYYKKALAVRELIKKELTEAFSDFDAILSPTAPTTAPLIGKKRENITDVYAEDLCCVPANIAGIPAITLPCGEDSAALPIGVQLMGAHCSEGKLYRIAEALEEVLTR